MYAIRMTTIIITQDNIVFVILSYKNLGGRQVWVMEIIFFFYDPGGDHSTVCILIVASKHRNIQIFL